MAVTDGEDMGGHGRLGAQLRAKAQRPGVLEEKAKVENDVPSPDIYIFQTTSLN